jgi:hypothetical protein
VSDAHLKVQCSGQTTTGACTLDTSAQVSVDRVDDTLSGAGTTALMVTGTCGPLLANTIESIQISGSRLSPFQSGRAASNLVATFVPFAALIGAGQ